MSKNAHTPGPWIVDPDHPRDISPADDLRFGVASICNCDNINGGWVFGDQSKANARLISADPDLLEACEAYIHAHHSQIRDGKHQEEFHQNLGKAERMMIDAIAKARGES